MILSSMVKLRAGKPGGFQTGGFPFSGKVRIVSRTLSGLFLVGAVNRPRKRQRTNRENPWTIPGQIGKLPEKSGKSQKRQKSGRKKAHKHKLFALVNVQMALGQTAGCPRVKRAKKFMCSPRNTGNRKNSLWLTGGLSQGCPDFQKVYVFKVYVPFSCPKKGRTIPDRETPPVWTPPSTGPWSNRNLKLQNASEIATKPSANLPTGKEKAYTTTLLLFFFRVFWPLLYALLSGPMAYTLFPCFPRKMGYTIFFFSVTSRSGDRPRKEGCHGGCIYFFYLVLRKTKCRNRSRKRSDSNRCEFRSPPWSSFPCFFLRISFFKSSAYALWINLSSDFKFI